MSNAMVIHEAGGSEVMREEGHYSGDPVTGKVSREERSDCEKTGLPEWRARSIVERSIDEKMLIPTKRSFQTGRNLVARYKGPRRFRP